MSTVELRLRWAMSTVSTDRQRCQAQILGEQIIKKKKMRRRKCGRN
jgi:hypothetical protein